MKKYILMLFTLFSTLFVVAEQKPVFFTPMTLDAHLSGYTDEEKAAIEKDLSVVRSVCMSGVQKAPAGTKPVFVATAGGPGSRKSTILERFLQRNSQYGTFAYLDADTRTLKYMVHTYYSRGLSPLALAENTSYSVTQRAAYEKWRPASNYIALTLLEEAFAQRVNIVHGATKTPEYVPAFLSNVKDAGYEVVLLLCSCEDSLRYQAIQYRNNEQKFYQSTPEDAVTKGKMFPHRMPAYFTYADELYLYWSDDLAQPERCAARFKDGKLEVRDNESYAKFIKKYENDRTQLKKEGSEIPSWEAVIAIYKNKFNKK